MLIIGGNARRLFLSQAKVFEECLLLFHIVLLLCCWALRSEAAYITSLDRIINSKSSYTCLNYVRGIRSTETHGDCFICLDLDLTGSFNMVDIGGCFL